MNATRPAKTTNAKAVEELDVLVVGAGFAGLYQLDHLRRLGYNVKVFEAGSDIGGVWYWNCYPGARVDTYGPLYQFSSEELWRDWNYGELYPSWEELRAYFRRVEKKLGLSRDIRFDTRVTGAEFDTDRDQWVVQASDGSVTRAKFFVLCTGLAAKPYIPPIAGLKDFRGICHHTAVQGIRRRRPRRFRPELRLKFPAGGYTWGGDERGYLSRAETYVPNPT